MNKLVLASKIFGILLLIAVLIDSITNFKFDFDSCFLLLTSFMYFVFAEDIINGWKIGFKNIKKKGVTFLKKH